MRRWWGLLLACIAATVACVDGATPDCSTVSSGCYPSDASGSDGASDAADASSTDASDASDAAIDATDAATDAAID
jgi:hypothetical protein